MSYLGAPQDTANDFVQGRARTQQELGLKSPDRHLYDRAPIGYEAESSRHAPHKDGKRDANVISE